ncbi:MAG: exopolyphosphatase, partial [Verrucomicrobia bacterium]|nr:exopolyphosphatase [Verrucomicrobiota bacterium]
MNTRPDAVDSKVKLFAVIDIGTTSVRMAIAQVDEAGTVHQLESVSQGVELGKDTFTRGDISKATTEECVEVLSSFKRLLEEYQVISEQQIHAVATSAVREAGNRQAFLDRIYVATGINVEPIDEAEVNRYTYLSILPLIERTPSLKKSNTLIAEVGGGSTEFLALHEGQVVAAQSHRLGSLRMREMLEDFRAPAVRERAILEEHIRRTVNQVAVEMGAKRGMSLLALGGEARFAARELMPKWDQKSVARVSVEKFRILTEKILKLSVDEIVSRYHLDYPSAETLGPALLSYLRLAETFKRKFVKVAAVTLRDGLLAEMASQDYWIQQSRQQIIHSALELGRKYQFDEAHAQNVASHCQQLFEALKSYHGFSTRHELILTVSALLHEIGLFVSNRSHHKHSLYLIKNSSLFGLG